MPLLLLRHLWPAIQSNCPPKKRMIKKLSILLAATASLAGCVAMPDGIGQPSHRPHGGFCHRDRDRDGIQDRADRDRDRGGAP